MVLTVAGLIAVIMTWPLAANFDTFVAGGGSAGDTTGYIWDLWSNSTHGMDVWGGGVQQHVGLPFGRTIIGGANMLLLFYNAPGAILGTFLPTIAAYNVVVLAGMALTGASMYLFIRWMGLGMAAAAWAGVAFEIFPYEALRVAAHPPLAWLIFVPLLLMACVYWLQGPTWRRAILIAAVTLFAWLSNPYFGAMALVAVGVTLVVGIVMIARAAGGRAVALRLAEAIAAQIVIVAIPLAMISAAARGVADQLVTRQRIELSLYGANLGDYVKPLPGQFLWSGILGTDTSTWPFASPGGERTVFLGWTVLIAAALGLALTLRMRNRLDRRIGIAVVLVIPMALVMVIFSLASPYEVFGYEITMPSSLVFDYLPFLRVYARFGLFVMACVLVLGAVGLSLLMRGRSITWRASVTSVAIILTAMELPISVPIGTGVPLSLDGKHPQDVPTWNWLASHDPGAVVMETPAFPNEVLDRQFLYGQLIHGHPLANGGLNEPGTPSDFGREYGNPLFPAAAAAYATAGIKYVVINPWAWRQSNLEPPKVTSPPDGYAVVAALPDGSGIWRVTAAPAKAIAFPAQGWWDPDTINGVRWRYMKDTATYTAWAPHETRVVISFGARGLVQGPSYRLTVTAPDGRTQAFAVTRQRQVVLRAQLAKGTSTFRLSASGAAPQQISATDLRIATLQISQWVLR